MADLTVDPNAVRSVVGRTSWVVAAAALQRGQVVYEDAARQYDLAQGNDQATDRAAGIVLTDAGVGERANIQLTDQIILGAVLLPGEFYVVSAAAAGAIAPISDITTGNWPFILGQAIDTAILKLDFLAGSVARG